MFKKLSIVLILVAWMCSPVWADKRTVNAVHTSAKATPITVSLTSAVYTHSMSFANEETRNNVGVFYRANPATADTTISFEQSFRKPTTEGSDDSDYLFSQVIHSSLNDGLWHLATIDSVKGIFGRFKILGNSSNPATTVLDIRVIK